MNRSIPLITAALAGIAGCAASTPQPEAAAQAEEPTVEEKVVTPVAKSGGVICRVERSTGTNVHRKVCMTESEREAAARKSQEYILSHGSAGGVHKVEDPADPRSE